MIEHRSSQFITHLLCLLFGMLGIHRFYVGKFWTGLLMLVTLGLGGLWQIIDLIWVGSGHFRDSEGQKLLVDSDDDFQGTRSQLVAYVLCFALGFLGLHRFYLGRYLSGILMLLTFGGLGVWWLIDLLIVGGGLLRDDYNNLTKC